MIDRALDIGDAINYKSPEERAYEITGENQLFSMSPHHPTLINIQTSVQTAAMLHEKENARVELERRRKERLIRESAKARKVGEVNVGVEERLALILDENASHTNYQQSGGCTEVHPPSTKAPISKKAKRPDPKLVIQLRRNQFMEEERLRVQQKIAKEKLKKKLEL